MFLERLNKNGIKGNKFYYDAEYSAFTASNIQMPNCTAYAYGRSGEIANQNIRPSGLSKNNAKNWYVNSSSTWVRSSTPKVGAVACWTGDLGHVAIVERVMDDGSCLVSQSNYTRESSKMDANFFQLKQYKMEVGKVTSGVGLVFQGYLLNPFVDLNTVERDTSKNQVKVLAEQIRARKAANGKAYEGLYIPMGLYDVLDTKVDGYTWAKIADDVWFATNDDEKWTETYISQGTPENNEEEKPISSVPNILKGEKWELDDFFKKLDEILNSKTRYLLGGIGRYDGDTRLFDCVGLFKSILWNYPAEPNNYGVTYPDVNVGGMKSRAKVQAFDKDKMQKGMLVFIGTEHIGMVYDDRIIECTPAFKNCVQLTTLEQRSDKPWDSMGYADFLEYTESPSEPVDEPKEPSDIDTLLNELQSSIATLQAQNKELSEKNANLEKELSDVKSELDTANSKLDEIRKVVS